ncbi:MAG: hypothetical protein ACI915_004295 [Gammaproteobacteria bacterium]|jgi:hypothetical protein
MRWIELHIELTRKWEKLYDGDGDAERMALEYYATDYVVTPMGRDRMNNGPDRSREGNTMAFRTVACSSR